MFCHWRVERVYRPRAVIITQLLAMGTSSSSSASSDLESDNEEIMNVRLALKDIKTIGDLYKSGVLKRASKATRYPPDTSLLDRISLWCVKASILRLDVILYSLHLKAGRHHKIGGRFDSECGE